MSELEQIQAELAKHGNPKPSRFAEMWIDAMRAERPIKASNLEKKGLLEPLATLVQEQTKARMEQLQESGMQPHLIQPTAIEEMLETVQIPDRTDEQEAERSMASAVMGMLSKWRETQPPPDSTT
jgi:AmiR/NasT family two-component response regulator